MFGRKMFAAKGVAADREEAVLAAAGLSLRSFEGFGKLLQGTRRQNLIYLSELSAIWESNGLRLSFSLPTGSYATVLLREVMKAEAESDDRE
jgi:tRNA pseudouridine13 synthase